MERFGSSTIKIGDREGIADGFARRRFLKRHIRSAVVRDPDGVVCTYLHDAAVRSITCIKVINCNTSCERATVDGCGHVKVGDFGLLKIYVRLTVDGRRFDSVYAPP